MLAAYRLLAPGSEWRLYRQWYDRTALADLLGTTADLAEIHKLYACHDHGRRIVRSCRLSSGKSWRL